MKGTKKQLLDFLKSQRLMSLATFGNSLCACNVYFAVDDAFNLYFMSEPSSDHCKNIVQNNTVACTIADSRQKVTDKKIGVQIKGVVEKVDDSEKIKLALSLWNKANPGFESVINFKNIQENSIKSKVYTVIPLEMKFLNEASYGPEGSETFLFSRR